MSWASSFTGARLRGASLPTASGSQRVADLAQDVYSNTGEIVTLLASLSASLGVEMLDYVAGTPARPDRVLLVPNPGVLPRTGIDALRPSTANLTPAC